MISADLHMHTYYSHGKNSPFEMHAAAERKGLALIGFSEHSPRPQSYDYSHEYRERLMSHFPDYIRDVTYLREKTRGQGGCEVLLGLEVDWFSAEEAFVRKACEAYDYDYRIGSVHFLDHWGFDDVEELWRKASVERVYGWYEEYFNIWLSMLESGLFQIAAHPDLIKIYSVEQFHSWLKGEGSRDLVFKCLRALKEADMAMEISSAGLRKACKEIYPCPEIMEMAQKLDLNVSLASDAHNTRDVAASFNELASYARNFGFNRQSVYRNGQWEFLPF